MNGNGAQPRATLLTIRYLAWIAPAGLILSGFSVVLGAMFTDTDTASAKVVRFVGSAFAIAVVAYTVF